MRGGDSCGLTRDGMVEGGLSCRCRGGEPVGRGREMIEQAQGALEVLTMENTRGTVPVTNETDIRVLHAHQRTPHLGGFAILF